MKGYKKIYHLSIEYNTIQWFIDTPLVGLFSDNATKKN